MTSCKNCNEPLVGKYCSNCGQSAGVQRISISTLIHDLPHAVFHIDKGILFNFVQLLKRPGRAIEDYLSGKRKSFFHPASYLVLALVLNYLVVKITNLHFFDVNELKSMDPLAARVITDYDAMQWWFLEHTYIYILLAIPASSFFLFLLFKGMKQSFNVAETAVVVLFAIAEGVLIQSFIYLVFGWIHSGPFIRTVESCNLVILILYASYVIFQLITPARPMWLRLIVSLFGGFGLAAVWVASAYLLYLIIG